MFDTEVVIKVTNVAASGAEELGLSSLVWAQVEETVGKIHSFLVKWVMLLFMLCKSGVVRTCVKTLSVCYLSNDLFYFSFPSNYAARCISRDFGC